MQDAAYDSLLKSRRQELHAKIARVIGQRFPNIKTAEPEVLARHLTEAGQGEAAIPLWHAAGGSALKRMALTEAISHLNRGLESITSLPPSSQRDARELELRGSLGTAWSALKGWTAPEVWSSLHPAYGLAKSLNRTDALIRIVFGLWDSVLNQGRVADSRLWAQEMMDIARASGDSALLVVAHLAACACHRWAGNHTGAVEEADKVLDLYDEEKHRGIADVLNQDPKTLGGMFSSIATWILGYPDQALRKGAESEAHARLRGHPFDLGYTLIFTALECEGRCEPGELRNHAEECEQLGRENGLFVLWASLAPRGYALARIRKGNVAEGIGPLKASIAAVEVAGAGLGILTWKTFLAEAMALAGDLDNALPLLDEQIEQIERPGWEGRYFLAEILRLKGWMLSLKGDPDGAERNYLISLDWARRQQAKMWELRTSTSLARLWQGQGKRQEAYDLLAPVYAWFTEGFDIKHLLDAKALLAELR